MIDFRSDTVTKPTPEMYAAMASAPVGDDVFGDDPTVKKLEESCAQRLGKDAGLFVPSGTMANLVSVATHCQPGDEVFLSEGAHMYEFECGALSAVAGTVPRIVQSEFGAMNPDSLGASIRAENIHFARPRLLSLENTHNTAGGVAIPLEHQKKLCAIARKRGLAIHLDGARIWNAAIALGVDAKDLVADVDSVSFCFSKGLSAPVGSIVLGSADFIERARKKRKMFGGGMRQIGILAAAAQVAVDTMVDRLAEDHRRAADLAASLEGLETIRLIRPGIQTNMVFVDVSGAGMTSLQVTERCRELGLLVSAPSRFMVRLVANRHSDDKAAQRAAEILREVIARG